MEVKLKQGMTPKLRFPGFSGGWEKKTLGEISEFFDNKRIPLKSTDRQKRAGKYPYYGASGIIDYIDDYIFDGEYIILGEDGANIIDRSSRLVFLAKGKFWVNNHAHVFQAHDSNYFLTEYLESLKYDKYNTGTAQPKLNSEVLKNLPIIIPPASEQKKIASFLTVIDNWINNLGTQREQLEQYKKGMMQKIFSQEIRFKDENGKDFPDWKERMLGDFAKITTGSSNREDSTELGDYVFFDRSMDARASRKYIFDDEALIVAGEGLDFKPRYYHGKFDLHQRAYAILKNGAEVEWKYLYYYIYQFRRYFSRMAVGTTIPSLRLPIFQKMQVKLPTKSEQEKISQFLTVIDEAVESKATMIAMAIEWKKGLVQQMFV